MGISIDKSLRQQLIFVCIIFMLTGLFTSRALLSAAMILFLLFTCFHKKFTRQLVHFSGNPLLLGMSLLFFIPFLTWFWSEDKQIWWRFARIKLPLLLLPLAFAGDWQLSPRQWKMIAYCFLALVFAGICLSFWQYMENRQSLDAGYLRAKVIPTPFENDHVRFSLVVCIGVLCSALLIKSAGGKTGKMLLVAMALVFIIYLHVLSARTGLVSLYILSIAGVFHAMLRLRKTKWIAVWITGVLVMPLAAWFLLPTFQNRIRYFLYDFSYIQKESYLPGANDGNRTLSIKAGWDILKEHPLGVGSGDVFRKTNEWYDRHIPQMLETDKIYPSSEALMYGAMAGWPALAVFAIVMLIPFFVKTDGPFFWIGLNMIIFASFIFDIGLEVQFGVFIYAFIVLWWWKWLRAGPAL